MTIFFTADTHYFHEKIIGYCDRPFRYAHEMNNHLIANHNAVVKNNDSTYFLGDFAFGDPKIILPQLNGKKFLILGNHDRWEKQTDVSEYAEFVKPYYELYVDDPQAHKGRRLIVLMHYAMRVWNKSHHNSWHLYGHNHGNLPEDPMSFSFDVGVDAIAKRLSVDGNLNPTDYRPISYEEVKLIMSKKANK